MTTNVKQAMMNQLVVQMMTAPNSSTRTLVATAPGLGLYLDLFSDEQQTENFCLVKQIENGVEESVKFGEVFKNDIQTLDDVDMTQGNIFSTLNGCITDAFGGQNASAELLYQPSITAARVNSVDRFTYQVMFNLNLAVNRNIIGDRNDFGEKKYIIGNATVKNMLCNVSGMR